MARMFNITTLLVCIGLFSSPISAFVHGLGGIAKRAAEKCPAEYKKIPGHSRCKDPSPNLNKEHSGVSAKDIQTILHDHNVIRGNVKPPAADLTPLKWSKDLAAVAQSLANTCTGSHDGSIQRYVPSLGVSVGQNIAMGHQNWRSAIKGWHSEVSQYTYGKDMGPKGWRKIGHYSQLVMNTTHLVGCGFASCSEKVSRFYVCNYGTGQMMGQYIHPYTPGQRCGACPTTCVQGLCDCRGLVCKNGGTLDLETCSCRCPTLYKGASCDQVKCPEQDYVNCKTGAFIASNCEKFAIVRTYCPFMCELCP